jgi:hypothetical protein
LLRRANVFDIAAHRFILRSLRNSKALPMDSKIAEWDSRPETQL